MKVGMNPINGSCGTRDERLFGRSLGALLIVCGQWTTMILVVLLGCGVETRSEFSIWRPEMLVSPVEASSTTTNHHFCITLNP